MDSCLAFVGMESEKCKHDYTIRVMTSADTPGALRVFASHGLFEANHSLDTYRLMDCNAFYVAIDDTNGMNILYLFSILW